MNPEEIKLLNNFLNIEEVIPYENEDIKKLAEKVSIIVKQILLQEQYNKDLKVLLDKLDELDKINEIIDKVNGEDNEWEDL